MSRILVAFMFFCSILVGCKNEQAQPIAQDGAVIKDDSFKRTLPNGDYAFEINYDAKTNISNLKSSYKGKKINQFDFMGKAGNELFLDLNKDGNKEFYFTTQLGGEANIQAFHLIDGKAIRIQKDDYNLKDKTQIYEYKFVKGQLVEKYRTKLENNKTGFAQSEYNLVFTSKGWELLPQGWHPTEIDRLDGQYASRDATGVGYYKVMMLHNLGDGTFNVDIKVKRNGDKKVLCDFNANGVFRDKSLLVPLNQVQSELKGTLKISLLGLQAAVYTENPEDSKDMVTVCNGERSIAGNFKKTDI